MIFNKKKSFTIVELTVVLGMIAILASYVVINLTSVQHSTYMATTVDTFISDLKQQQLKAMVGDTEGRGVNDYYGIYFQTNIYYLFHGANYSFSTSNQSIPLTNSIEVSATTFPQSQIVFNKGSGEIVGFTAGANTVTLRNIVTDEQKIITINRYGVITQIN